MKLILDNIKFIAAVLAVVISVAVSWKMQGQKIEEMDAEFKKRGEKVDANSQAVAKWGRDLEWLIQGQKDIIARIDRLAEKIPGGK